MAVEIGNGSRVLVSVVGAGLKGDKGDHGGGLESVGLSMPTGFDVAGSPVSGVSGSFTVTLSEGYFLLTEAEKDKLAGLGDAPVTSVNSATGDVVLDYEDVGAEPERTLVSDVDAEAGTSTSVFSWSPAKVRLAARAAINGSWRVLSANLTSAAPEHVFDDVLDGDAFRLDLKLTGSRTIYNIGPGETAEDIGLPGLDVRFSTNGGVSYGSWQEILADTTGAGTIAGSAGIVFSLIIDLQTGDLIESGVVSGSVTVPSGVTHMEFRRVSSVTAETVQFAISRI